MSNTNGNPEHKHPHGKAHVPESGAIYFIKVNDQIYKSEAPLLKVSDILALAGANPETHDLLQTFSDGEKKLLPNDEIVNLANLGIEQFHIEKRLVEVFFKDHPYKVHMGDTEVKDLKKLFGVPLAHHLSVLVHNELKPLDDNGTIFIRGGEKFISYPCDGSAG